MKLVRIYPKTNFRTFLNSDTLWGNIVYAYKLLYGDTALTKLLNDYQDGKSPFKVSSVFPYEIVTNGNNPFIHYFPKPILSGESIQIETPEDMILLKEFKSIRYVEQSIFEKYLSGEINDKILFERFKEFRNEEEKDENKRSTVIIEKNKLRYLKNLLPNYNLHNSIDRMSGTTLQAEGRGQLYWEDEYSFYKSDFGLFFFVEVDNQNEFEASLRLLSHIGIGGNRSIGKGCFEFQIEEFSINEPNNFNGHVLLSLYHPTSKELELLSSEKINYYYDIVTRIGFVAKDFNLEPQGKNPVHCFTEGSTFITNQNLAGSLVPTAKTKNQKNVLSNYLFFGVKANLRLQ